MKGRQLRRAVDDALRSVNLFSVGDDLVGGYRWVRLAPPLWFAVLALSCPALHWGLAICLPAPLSARPPRRPRHAAAAPCCSGGMKRRLSVAISLVGDPLVVYLDEPSTGTAGTSAAAAATQRCMAGC